MKTWSLTEHDPICLTLSADARFVQTDYSNDQIWELGWWDNEIPSIWLQSTYGRRAQSMKIFPVFTLEGETRQDPSTFSKAVQLSQILPNLASIEFAPFRDLLIRADYYVPDSHAVTGRFIFQNLGLSPQMVNLRLSGYLQPGSQGNPMGVVEFDGVETLSGSAANICPVIMMSGGAHKVPSAYPSIEVDAEIRPGDIKTWVWAHSALNSPDKSFERCRELIQIPWEPVQVRIEMGNSRMLKIQTGNPDWDSVLWMAQKELLRGFIGPTAHNSRVGLIARRGIEDGYALSTDGKDHTGIWGGMGTADTYYLARQALPIAPEFVKDLIRNILRTQNPAGELDWAPGMGSQRSGFQAMPLLASLAWDCYQWTEDKAFLEEVFPGLFSFYKSWFTQAHDRDGDGYPEWNHAIQTGLEERPIFNRFDPQDQGFNIAHAETVDLAAYLYREGRALIAMAQALDRVGLTTVIQEHISALHMRVEATWSEKKSSYRHVDRDSHNTQAGLQLLKRRGESSTTLDRLLDPPSKLLLRLKGDPARAKKLKVEIVSEGAKKRGRTEIVTHKKFQFFWEWGTHTTDKLNHRIQEIRVKGIDTKMTMEIVVPDLEREDITLNLPLWAGWLDGSRIRTLVHELLANPEAYWRQNGLSTIPATDGSYDRDGVSGDVRMLWNSMIGVGLVEHGFREKAGQLFQKLMAPAIEILKREKRFYSHYQADGIQGLGVKGGLQGIVPLDLFLAILGVRLISPTKVWVWPGHPFPWPVKIEWQGLSLECQQDVIHIRFPDGQRLTVEGDEGRMVEQLDEGEDR